MWPPLLKKSLMENFIFCAVQDCELLNKNEILVGLFRIAFPWQKGVR